MGCGPNTLIACGFSPFSRPTLKGEGSRAGRYVFKPNAAARRCAESFINDSLYLDRIN